MMTGEDIKILHEGPSLISFRGAFDAAGSRLPSNPPRLFSGLVAQLVEQCPFKALVQGSSPCQPTTLPVRAGFKTTRGAVFAEKAGWRGVTKESIRGGSLTEGQQSQMALSPKTLRAASLLSVTGVGLGVIPTSRGCGDVTAPLKQWAGVKRQYPINKGNMK